MSDPPATDRASEALLADEIAIQRGDLPARTIRSLVDAIRQDEAGLGAALSSLRYLSDKWPEATRAPLLHWVERGELHLNRLSAKGSLAIEEYYETLPSGEGAAELAKARRGESLTTDEILPALRAAMEVADRAKEKGRAIELKRAALASALEDAERDRYRALAAAERAAAGWERTTHDLDEAREENQRLREALSFYAEQESYARYRGAMTNDATEDGGTIARKALAEGRQA